MNLVISRLPAMKLRCLLLLAGVQPLAGCGTGQRFRADPSARPVTSAADAGVGSPRSVSCAAWHREPVPDASSVLINNVWNEQWAQGQEHEQCLLVREQGGANQFGWAWHWPAYRPYSSYAAPGMLFGWKAWDGGPSTSLELPRRIDAIDSLTVDFAVDIAADETHNLNATMWLTHSDQASAQPNPDDVTNEVMVWFHNPGGLGGGITHDGAVTLDGLTFDVWHLVNHRDASGGTDHPWTMVIYINQSSVLERRFDLAWVLKDAVAKGLAEPAYAVGGVELITEVFGGSGELWLKRFGVDVLPSR